MAHSVVLRKCGDATALGDAREVWHFKNSQMFYNHQENHKLSFKRSNNGIYLLPNNTN